MRTPHTNPYVDQAEDLARREAELPASQTPVGWRNLALAIGMGIDTRRPLAGAVGSRIDGRTKLAAAFQPTPDEKDAR